MLSWQEENFSNGGKFVHEFGMNNMLKPLKDQEEYRWLKEVSNTSLKRICRDLDKAYRLFFEKKQWHPRFKSKKKMKPTYPICCENFLVQNSCFRVQKVGLIRYKSDYVFPEGKGHKFIDVRLHIEDDKYYITFLLEHESQVFDLTNKPMGIDLGVKELAIVAFGDDNIYFHNINKSKRIQEVKKKIKYIQRSISRKYRASVKKTGVWTKTNNIAKMERKYSRLNKRIVGIRKNYMHQITHQLIMMLPSKVVMEHLNVSGMLKNKHLSGVVRDQAFYEFTMMMSRKCLYAGILFIQAPRFFPSSKMCSCCGNIKRDLKLSDRTYICSNCGLIIDRDYNAAINLSKYTEHQDVLWL